MEYIETQIALELENQSKVEHQRLLASLSDALSQIEGIECQEVPAPLGAKGGIDLASLAVKAVEVGGINGVVAALGGWLAKDKDRKLAIQIGDKMLTISNPTPEDQRKLIELFRQQVKIQPATAQEVTSKRKKN